MTPDPSNADNPGSAAQAGGVPNGEDAAPAPSPSPAPSPARAQRRPATEADAPPPSPVSPPGPQVSADVEFEDESPGSYLLEFHVSPWYLLWALAHLGLTVALPLARRAAGPASEWNAPVTLLWKLLPVSILVHAIVLWWQGFSAYTPKSPINRWLLAVSLGNLVGWAVLNWLLFTT